MGLWARGAASIIKGSADGIDAVGTERCCLGDVFERGRGAGAGAFVLPPPLAACPSAGSV